MTSVMNRSVCPGLFMCVCMCEWGWGWEARNSSVEAEHFLLSLEKFFDEGRDI